ncbi:hypothetical protein KBZ12_18090 [Cyanobium sp. Cruz CV13-4-11]|uniref:ankyrin repeat domain-containing protein n=1 Tax=Cyanobium sp. Cruz CV11-17 TaxID=2823709 RepID=UPI0020CD030B|nr:ankyrin repeat domain-containing protein [Cyanobium sp. Cruz CV11-17]MCP9921348.1 hypothetical protein [Cyanobium sp. Cruz CV13-4-11]
MEKKQQSVESAYAEAKKGNWAHVLTLWQSEPRFASGCSRYVNPFSGWSFLHQAARFGHEPACRELIRLGTATGTLTYENESAADIARRHQHHELASVLQRSCLDQDACWCPPRDPKQLPSSNFWDEAQERKASKVMLVAYGGGVVKIPAGSRYFVDSFERTLIGWHGTYDPPGDMGCGSMV